MTYQRSRTRTALSADTSHGPAWYRAMGSIQSQPPGRPYPKRLVALGSLGADDVDTTTLSTPTITDPAIANAQWQAQVLAQLQAGVGTMKAAELQKWLQIAATVSIPLMAWFWKQVFPRLRKSASVPGVT